MDWNALLKQLRAQRVGARWRHKQQIATGLWSTGGSMSAGGHSAKSATGRRIPEGHSAKAPQAAGQLCERTCTSMEASVVRP